MRQAAAVLTLIGALIGAPSGGLGADVGVPFQVTDSPSVDPALLASSLTGIRVTAEPSQGRLTWDVAKAQLVDDAGTLMADVKTGDVESELSRVQGAIDKWTAVGQLAGMITGQPLQSRLEPPANRAYREGEQVSLEISGNTMPYFTLFNLSSDGTVNFLYPMAKYNDPPAIPIGGPYRLKLTTGAPFGADHFIAIASEQSLDSLHRALQEIDGKQEAAQVIDLLKRNLGKQGYEMGLQAVFSSPR